MKQNLSLLYIWKKCSSNKYSWWVSSPSSKMKSALTLMSVVLTFILSKTSKGSKLTARLRKTKRSKARKAPQPFLSKILFSCATKYHLSESNARIDLNQTINSRAVFFIGSSDLKSVTNLSPTWAVFKICHQHRCSRGQPCLYFEHMVSISDFEKKMIWFWKFFTILRLLNFDLTNSFQNFRISVNMYFMALYIQT